MRPTLPAGPIASKTSPPRTLSVVTAILLVLVTGCTAGSSSQLDEANSTGELSGATIVQPGSPGEPAATLGADAEVPETPWNDSDAAFIAMMIPHHAQALEMCELARTRAQSKHVKSLARRISGAQGPEIIAMSSWLQGHDLEMPAAEGDGHEHSHGDDTMAGMPDMGSMPGMLTESEMAELAAAVGARFDKLFLEGMIGHHQGAVQMADDVGTEGADILVSEMAADVGVGQSAEIDRMRVLLRG